ncbi:DUF2515 family protein [Chloroflexus sp.]|uniref:DUF2515 family protein n=1 Tax=Chloroflexus sp. TaxID=1904827 RepID=UPI00261BEF6B|nr:hypothetical protein [uncultured Chloroflexus sp.]
MPSQTDWRNIIDQHLPPPDHMRERNRAITAAYADWYLRQPWLFRWAGLAAFASAQVGIGIAIAESLMAPQRMVRNGDSPASSAAIFDLLANLVGNGVNLALVLPVTLHEAAAGQLLSDLLIIKQANDAIFHDTGWAHLAYIHGGLPALEHCLAADHPIRAAFCLLDEGAHLMCEPTTFTRGWDLVDQATVALLRREQMTILPPYMDRLSDVGRLVVSLGSWMDFTGDGPMSGSSFVNFFGLPAVLSGARSIANTSDRWTWIERDVLPVWFRHSATYRQDSPLDRQLRRLALW